MGRRATKSSDSQPLALHQLPGQLVTEEDLEGDHWYDCFPEWPAASGGGLRATAQTWREVAAEALTSASRAFEKNVGATAQTKSRALAKEQTAGDRIAAVTLLVQESPLHRLDELRTLLGYAQKKGRKESEPAIEAIKDLMISNLLPERRLVQFEDREWQCERLAISKRHLVYALFEDELKAVYGQFLQVLEHRGSDHLTHFKTRAVRTVFDLLVAKPEMEKALLAMLVNKLGDPDKKVSSTASYNLSQLIEKHHPQMRLVVVREVEHMLLRPNITRKAQYFAIVFLNQIRFTRDDVELARKLLKIYMDLFKACITTPVRSEQSNLAVRKPNAEFKKRKDNPKRKKKKATLPKVSEEVEQSRLMGALLIGANRAFPYSEPDQDDTSYEEHYNTLFRVAHSQALGPATQALAFLLQVSQSQTTQSDRFYRALYSRLNDAAEAGEPKQARFLSLLLKAMQADTDSRRLKAYMKRLLQASLYGTASFAGACALVLSECFKGRKLGPLKSYISLAESWDAEENFVDADRVVEDAPRVETLDGDEEKVDRPREDHMLILPGKDSKQVEGKQDNAPTRDGKYDPMRRDPQYSRAEGSSLWELVALCSHFHPSVSLFANTMCVELKNVRYDSDPLQDFSMIAFLDKFSYKKAKNRVAKSLYGKRSGRYNSNPVANSREFQELAESGHVGEDDKFFARFFTENPSRVQDEILVDGNQLNEDRFGVDSEEEAFEQAMREEMKRIGGDDGFTSAGIIHHVADIDDEDEDEMKAFAEAFKEEMVASEEESEDNKSAIAPPSITEVDGEDEDIVVPLAAFEDSDSDEPVHSVPDIADLQTDTRPSHRKNHGKNPKSQGINANKSVFAAAEDYERDIEIEEEVTSAAEKGEPALDFHHRKKSLKRGRPHEMTGGRRKRHQLRKNKTSSQRAPNESG